MGEAVLARNRTPDAHNVNAGQEKGKRMSAGPSALEEMPGCQPRRVVLGGMLNAAAREAIYDASPNAERRGVINCFEGM